MKAFIAILAGLFLAFSGRAQTSIAGYYNLTIRPGDNLIANQLSYSDNTLNAIFSPFPPVGLTFTRWDPVAQQFLPGSTYLGAGSGWSINYGLNFGEGGILRSPILWTNTFVGEVAPAFDFNTGALNWHPNYPNGLHLLSSPIPITAPIDINFTNAVGRLPQAGEWVAIFDPATQLSTFTTFHTGTGWDNGDPVLGIGQSAWFDLGGGLAANLSSIPMVPEPGATMLACAAIATLLIRRRARPLKTA